MTIGVHSVLLYPDPNAGGWAPIGLYNNSFDLGLDGWQASPFCPAPTAPVPGLIRQVAGAGGNTLSVRPTTAHVPLGVDTALYRVTMQVTVSEGGAFFYGLNWGDTAEHAAVGEYWGGAGTGDNKWAAVTFPTAGTYTVDMTANPSTVDTDAFPWVCPFMTVVDKGRATTIDYLRIDLDYLVGEAVDISCLVDEVSIQHGRDDTTGQPDASTATLELDLSGGPLPALADIGSVLAVSTTLGVEGNSSVRFYGRITDINVGWDDAGELTPESPVGQIQAASLMADLGRRVVGDAPFPQELDGARVQRILTLAGLDPNPVTSDPGTVQILPRDIDAQAALEVARDAAESAGGIIWQTRDSDVRYADASHRRNIPASLVLDSCDILVTPTWSRTLAGLINKVTIAYGPTPSGGEQATTSGQSATSQARYGVYDYSLTSELAALADAQALVGLLLARNSSPVWVMTSLPIDLKGLDQERTAVLLGLEMHELVELTGLPLVTSQTPTSAHLWVEGWTERLAWGEHEIELAVSGYCRTAPAPRWDDVAADWSWDELGDTTWDEAACLGPPTQHDRWTDVPASVRWDTVPPTTTWDNYTGDF